MGLVKYYNEISYSGNLGVFHKPMSYQHQSEFRFYAKYEKNEPLVLKIEPMPESMHLFDISELPHISMHPEPPDKRKKKGS